MLLILFCIATNGHPVSKHTYNHVRDLYPKEVDGNNFYETCNET